MPRAISPDDLTAMADRIEGAVRRDIDLVRTDVREIRDQVIQQGNHIVKVDAYCGTVDHKLRNHLHTHGLHAAITGQATAAEMKPGKQFVAGVLASLAVLAILGNWIADVLPVLIKRLVP